MTITIIISLLIIALGVIIKKVWMGEKSKSTKKTVLTQSDTPTTGNTNPPPAGHATPKKKSKFVSRFFTIIGIVIALAVTIALIFWVIDVGRGVIKKWNAPKPHNTTYTVQTVKTVRISASGDNTVYVPWKADARFKKATIAFCVENNLGQSVCGDAGSDPNLPKGTTGEGQTLWFTPRDSPNQSGTIDILITEIKQKIVYY